MNLDAHYVHLDGLMWFPLDGGLWIVRSMEEDKFYKMKQDGKNLYELIDGSRSVSEIIENVCRENNLDKEEATKEITQFFEDLLNLGLIVPVDKVKGD